MLMNYIKGKRENTKGRLFSQKQWVSGALNYAVRKEEDSGKYHHFYEQNQITNTILICLK